MVVHGPRFSCIRLFFEGYCERVVQVEGHCREAFAARHIKQPKRSFLVGEAGQHGQAKVMPTILHHDVAMEREEPLLKLCPHTAGVCENA